MFDKQISSDTAAAGSQFSRERDYWLRQLSGSPEKVYFGYDHHKRADGPKEVESVLFQMTGEIFSKVIWTSNESDYRLHMILVAALVVLLEKYTGSKDIILGTSIYKQPVEGDFVNTVLALRNRLWENMTFKELLYQVKQTIEAALKNQNYPIKALLHELKLSFSETDFPLFDIVMLLENIQDRKYVKHIHPNMVLSFLRKEACIEGRFEYNPLNYERSTVEQIIVHFKYLLGQVLYNVNLEISGIDILPEKEKRQLLEDFNNTGMDYPEDKTIHVLFEDQVEQVPNRAAVECQGSLLTYAAVNEMANRLACLLRSKGVKSDTIVGIMVERSSEMVAGLLGILKAGGAYLPIDIDCPTERIRFMMEDSSARILLSGSSKVSEVSKGIEGFDLNKILEESEYFSTQLTHLTQPTHLCYVIYTSGSTGRPKGVLVNHRGVVNLVYYHRQIFGEDREPGLRMSQVASPGFDAMGFEIWPCLTSGSALVIINNDVRADAFKLKEWLIRHRITISFQATVMAEKLLDEQWPEHGISLKMLRTAGDRLTRYPDSHHPFLFYNLYGPTEDTVWTTWMQVKPEGKSDRMPAIGGPVGNHRVYILGPDAQLQPLGVYGELCIAGCGLANGYLNSPELMTEKFMENPFVPGEILYRTGDLGRWLPDGNIEFQGREDNQVKIRGFRIELGEVENTLKRHRAVQNAVVVPEGQNDSQSLTAYVVPDETCAFTVRQLLTMEKQGLTALHNWGELPNGMPIFYMNRSEIDYMYREDAAELSSWEEKGITLGRGDVVFDVGANIGLFSLLTYQQYLSQELSFYLFEPIPAVNHLLGLNISLYGIPAQILSHAVAAAEGEREFTYFPNDSLLSGYFPGKQEEINGLKTIIRSLHLSENRQESVNEHLFNGMMKDRLRTESVRCSVKTLSQVIRENQVERIDLLKVDIGKYGVEILKGIEAEDWPKIRQIAVEIEDMDGSLQWVRQILGERGYQISIERNEDFDTPALYNIYAVLVPRAARGRSSYIPDEGEHLTDLFFSPKRLSSELRQYAGQTLPTYMVPSAIVLLEELPLTSSGKVDRQVLPKLEISSTVETYVPPRNRVEEELVNIWGKILEIDPTNISTEANFFELGGHSLNATIMVARIHQQFNVKIPLIELFRIPTIRELAEYIGKEAVQEQHFSIEPIKKRKYYRLSSVQRRLYVLWRMEKENVVYNVPVVLEMEGHIDKERFEDSFRRLICRHESLRTSFEMNEGEPVQIIREEVDFKIETYPDLSAQPSEEEIIRDFIRPFDLTSPPLLRVGLIETGHHKSILMLDMHHIITDGVSMGILVKEFLALYEGSELLPLKIQYKDYAHWQQERMVRGELCHQEEYWKEVFVGTIPLLHLPTDYPRPNIMSFAGDVMRFDLDSKTVVSLKDLTRDLDVTLFMVLLAAFYVLLFKLSGQEDIVVGVPIAGRRHADVQPLIGMFVNTLALRSQVPGEATFTEFLGIIQKRLLKAYENQDFPFEDLVERILKDRNVDRNPLFDVMFAYGNIDIPEVKIPGLKIIPRPFNGRISRFDFTLIAEERDKLAFTMEYSTGLFKAETIARFIVYFNRVIASVLKDPEGRILAIDILTEEEKQQLLYDFNDTAADFPSQKPLHQLFEEQAARTGDRVAVIGMGHGAWGMERTEMLEKHHAITYKELNEKSIQLAHLLKEKGVGPNTVVGLMVQRSIEMMKGIFGILKAGGAYLPIDPQYPEERIRYMLADSSAMILVSEVSRVRKVSKVSELIDLNQLTDLTKQPLPNSPTHPLTSSPPHPGLAYVIYTSGSTGTPKGVMIEHHSVINRLSWMQAIYPIGSGDKVLQKTPIVFDVSVWELFCWSLSGSCLCLLGHGDEKDPQAIVEAVGNFGVTTMHFVPSMLDAFLSYIESAAEKEKEETLIKLKSVRQVFTSGEALGVGQVERLFRLFKGWNLPKLVSLYGPTETTVEVSYFDCEQEGELEKVPIGRPIHNSQFYVLNKSLGLQPIGVAGELYISGVQLARGYLNRPELTQEKFISAPKWLGVGDPLIYASGDLARWFPDGNIEFLGRMDYQVKVRGFRIELGEIENQLTSSGYSPIKEAVVTAGPGPTDDNQLIAYVVPNETSAYTVCRQLEVTEKGLAEGLSFYQWPNGMLVYYLNHGETDFMYHEIFEERSYLKHGITLNEGACIFDIGANIGVFSLFALRNCKNARIYAFEPLPPAYRLLSLNTSLYRGHFKTFNFGIGSTEEEVLFTYYPHAALLSGRFADSDREAATVKAFLLMQEPLETSDGSGEPFVLTEEQYDELLAERLTTTTYTCPMKPLSQVMDENEVEIIDLLKIDVEKAEMEVLEGIRQEHWPRIRQLVIEVHESEDRLHRIVQLLEGNGYQVAVEQEQLLEQTRLYNLYARREFPQEKGEQEEEQATKETPAWYSVDGLVRDTRDYLKNKLPDYMVPAHIVPLIRLPLTPNGKVDRKALPEPEIRPGTQYVAPQSDNEREITEIWKKVLGLEKIGVNDNFFDIGGNSLKIIQISVELKKLLGTDISMAKMFQYPTIASLARYIAKADHIQVSQEKEKEREEAVGVENIKSRLKQRRKRSRL